jgi:hypothetical protein
MKRNGFIEITLDPAEWDFRDILETELEAAIEYEYARESDALRERAKNFQLDDLLHADIFLGQNPEFPRPWLGVFRLDAEKERIPFDVQIVTGERIPAEFPYVFKVDWGMDKKTIQKAFAKWLNDESMRLRVHRPRGKAGEKRWCELKWLAARRLVRHGLRPGAAAKEAVKNYKLTHPSHSTSDVLPEFSSWDKALQAAERILLTTEKRLLSRYDS